MKKLVGDKYIFIDNVFYYLINVDNDFILRLYVLFYYCFGVIK